MTDNLTVKLVLDGDGSRLEGAVKRADGSVQKFSQNLEQSSQKTERALKRQAAQVDNNARSLQTLEQRALRAGAALLGAVGGAVLARELGRRADQYSELSARLNLVTDSSNQTADALARVRSIANDTGQGLGSVANLATRTIRALQSTGRSTEEALQQGLQLTEAVSNAVLVSGASAASADAALTQLSQGLASGVLRGEEFNSVMEQTPEVAAALARALNVTTGELREMALQGQLTTEVVTEALLSQAEALERQAAEIPPTIARAWQTLNNEITLYIGEADQAIGASRTLAETIEFLADNLGVAADVVAAVLVVALSRYIAVSRVGQAVTLQNAAAMALWTRKNALGTAQLWAGAAAAKGLTLAGRGLLALFGGPLGLTLAVGSLAAIFGNDLIPFLNRSRRAMEALAEPTDTAREVVTRLAEAIDLLDEPGALRSIRGEMRALEDEAARVEAALNRARGVRMQGFGASGISASGPSQLERDLERRLTVINEQLRLARQLSGEADYEDLALLIRGVGAAADFVAPLLQRYGDALRGPVGPTEEFATVLEDSIEKLRLQVIELVAGEDAALEYADSLILAAAAEQDAADGTTANTEAVRAQIQERNRLRAALEAEQTRQELTERAQERQARLVERLVGATDDLVAARDPLAARERELLELLDDANSLLELNDAQLSGLGLTSEDVAGQIETINDELDRLTDEREREFRALARWMAELGQNAARIALEVAGFSVTPARPGENNQVGELAANFGRSIIEGADPLDALGRSLRAAGGEQIVDGLQDLVQRGFNEGIERLDLSEEAKQSLSAVADGFALALGEAIEGNTVQAITTSIGTVIGLIASGDNPAGVQVGAALGNLIGSLIDQPSVPKFQVSGRNVNLDLGIDEVLETAIGVLEVGFRELEQGTKDAVIRSLQQFAQGIAGIVRDDELLAAIQREIDDVKFSSRSDGASIEQLIATVFDNLVDALDAGIASFIRRGATLEDRLARFEAAFAIDRALTLRRGLGLVGGSGTGLGPGLVDPAGPGPAPIPPGDGGGPNPVQPPRQVRESADAIKTFNEVLEGTEEAAALSSPALLETLELLEELQVGAEPLIQTFNRLVAVTGTLDEAQALLGVRFADSREGLVRFGADLVAFFGDDAGQLATSFGRVFDVFFTEEERARARAESARGRADSLLGDLGIDLTDEIASVEGFRALFDELAGTLSPEDLAILLEAGNAIADLIDAEGELADARGQSSDAARELADIARQVEDDIFSLTRSEFRVEFRNLRQETEEMIARVRELGGSEELLGRIRQREALAMQQLAGALRASLTDIFAQFSGQATASASTEIRQIGDITAAVENRYAREMAALERIGELVDNLLLSSLSPLNPQDRLNEARSQLNQAFAAAEGGDLNALEALPDLVNQYLAELQDFTGGVGIYPAEFEAVLARLADLQAAGPQNPPPNERPPTVGTINQAAGAIVNELTELQRIQLATQIVDQIGLLAQISGRTPSEIANEIGSEFGVSIGDLIQTLTGELPNLTGDALAAYFDNLVMESNAQLNQLESIDSTLLEGNATLAIISQTSKDLLSVAGAIREVLIQSGAIPDPDPPTAGPAPEPPPFAEGGWVNTDSVIRAGEAGRELVLPNPVSEFLARTGIPVNVRAPASTPAVDVEARRQLERIAEGVQQLTAAVVAADYANVGAIADLKDERNGGGFIGAQTRGGGRCGGS